MTPLDMLLDLVRTDIDHPEQRASIRRYEYSGRGHEYSDFKEGETLYAVEFSLPRVQERLSGTGRSLDDAIGEALRICISRLREWADDADRSADNDRKHAQWLRERIAAIESMKP
jgi:hypothetical protein